MQVCKCKQLLEARLLLVGVADVCTLGIFKLSSCI